jgi:homoserine dehydrogenase
MTTDVVVERDCTVAIVGFGTVGQAVARLITGEAHPGVRLTHICNRQIDRKKVEWVGGDVIWTESFDEVLASSVDVVIELIGGLAPASAWIEQSLVAGKSVVTANKQVIAESGAALQRIAQRAGQELLFEAAVAGGIPIVRGVREGLCGDRLSRIQGVLNGTCNYILTKMDQEHVSFADTVAEAQRLGYAEADPSADVDGYDARAKLAILIGVGLGRTVRVDDIPLRSIRSISTVDFIYARRLGCVVKQVARAALLPGGGVEAAVQPALVPETSTLARVGGSQNVVVVDGEFGGETAFSGFGAGGQPTAVAVVSDVLSVARKQLGGDELGLSEVVTQGAVESETGDDPTPVIRDFEAPHYVRFTIRDRPGIIASLAGIFSEHGINLDAVLQEPGWSKTELPFVVTLETCGSAAVRAALADIENYDFHVQPPLWLPILNKGEERP